MITIEEFEKWFGGLKPLDQMNFTTLVGLPKARELVEEMNGGQYKDMALFVIDSAKNLIEGLSQ